MQSSEEAILTKKDKKKVVLSKYVISNVILFLPFKSALQLRLVSRRFDEAVLIGFNILYFVFKWQIIQVLFINFTMQGSSEVPKAIE